MSERRAGTKGRRLGSSRRKQLQESPGQAPAAAPSPSEEPPWASEIAQRVQQLLSTRDTEQAGVVTRLDMQKLQEEGLPCSREELELVFDGLDAAGTGRLGTEEFTAGLRQFLSSQNAAREHRRRKTASRRVRLVLPSPVLERGDSEESRHFRAFMEQLGTENPSEEQEIWQLWVKLRQDEPQLLDNLEGFLARMRQRIRETRSEKEALELTLNRRVAEHDKDVQQLCETLERQIQQEQLRLQQQSMARSRQQGEELQRVLDASEREVQRLVTAQMELERRCHSLQSSQQATSTENQQLQESNRALQQHLQLLHQQLQHTQGHLRTMRATVAWEHMGEPRDRVVAELPIVVPMSPQLSPGKSEKFRSEMRIRLGSQSSESKAKSSHQVVWEMLPAETNLSGAPRKASSAEEDPFPEPLKEEGASDQSSLLREMNDAIAALSKHLKAQALGAPPALADTAWHPWDNAEPHTGPEAATAHETTPGVLQETLPGHIHRELLEGDLQEGPGTAGLRALDVTQAGGSAGAGHCRAQEPGAEQGESPEEAQRMLFLPGKGDGEEEMVLKEAEHLGQSVEAAEQVLMEVEGAGWLQETTAWAKPQLLGEAVEVERSQREDLEAGLGPAEAGQEGVAVGQGLAMDEQQPGRTLGVQALGTELQERADPALELSGKMETELGEHLEPQPPSQQGRAAHGEGVPEVAVAPGPGVLDEECARTEVQPQGQTTDSKVLEVLPARAERAGSEEEEVEGAEPREAEQQLQGECARGGAGWRGSVGALEPLAAAVPPTHGQGGGGTGVGLMEAPSSTNRELLAEVEADLQVWSEAGSSGTQQGGGEDPGVQLEKDKPEVGLAEEMGAAAVHSEGPSPAETPVGIPDCWGLFPGTSQALLEADLQLSGGLSSENPQGGESERAAQLPESEEEDRAEGQGEPQQPVPHPSEVTLGQGDRAGAGLELKENPESLDTAEDQSSGANVQLIAEGGELRLSPGGSTEADLQLMAGSSGTEQGKRLDPEVQLLEGKENILEMEVVDAQADLQLCEGPSPAGPWGGEGERAVQLEEEDGAQGLGEHGLSHEPEIDLHGSGVEHGEGADGDMQAQEEAESLGTAEEQSSGAIVQLIAEGDELRVSPGGSTETDLQPWGEAGTSGTEQGETLDPEEQHLHQEDNEEILERKAEDIQEDMVFHEGPSPGAPWGGESERAAQLEEEEEDGAQGQGEGELPHEPELDLQGSGVRKGGDADEDIQAQGEAESLDTAEEQSSGANVQLIAEGGELRVSPGGRTEADLQPWGEAGSSWTEQGGRLDPEGQPLDQEDKAELVEVEAEDVQEEMVFHEGPSPGGSRGGEGERAAQLEEEEDDEAQGQGEGELPHEPELDLQGSGVRQGGGADEDMQAQEKPESLDTVKDQRSGANVQLIAEGDELKSASGEGTEADLQLMAGSSGTEQGGRLDLEGQHLGQAHKEDILEMEVVDDQADLQLCVGFSPETPWGKENGISVQIEEEEDGAQGQGEQGLPHEPVPHPSAVTLGQGEGAGAGLELKENAESLDTAEEQSSGANVQLIAERGELRVSLGGSTEADLQPWGEAGTSGTEQGESVDPEVQHLDQGDKAELVEGEAEDAQAHLQLSEGPSSGFPWGGEIEKNVQIQRKDDEAQGQGEDELPHEPELDLQGSGVEHGEGADEDMQAQEEAESLGTVEDQSSGANVQLIAEGDELRVSPGGSTEADLQVMNQAGCSGTEQGESVDSKVQPMDQVNKEDILEMEVEDVQKDMMELLAEMGEDLQVWNEAGSSGTEQGGNVAPDVQTLDQDYKEEFLERKAEDVQEEMVFHEVLSPGSPWGGQGERTAQLEEEEDGAQGQGEDELPHQPELDLQGSGVEHGEGADGDMQAQEEAESLDTVEEQSSGANVQLIAEWGELKSASGESTEADLQPFSQTDSMGTEQGGDVAPDVHPLDQEDKAEVVEREAEDSWTDTQLCVTASPETPQGGGNCAAVQPRDGAGDGGQGQGQGGRGQMQELVHEPPGVTIRQRRGTDAGVQPVEEAESLGTVEDQSSGANVQLIAEGDELRLSPGGRTEAELQVWGEAGTSGTEQGGSVDPEVQPLDQGDKEELVEGQAEDVQEDRVFHEGPSPAGPWGGEGERAAHLEEEEDGARGQGEQGLSHEPEIDLHGSGVEHGEGADGDMQAQENAESLGTVEDQSTGANVQLIAEGGELRLSPGGSTEADLQLMAGSSWTEQGESVDPEEQPLDQGDKAELVEGEAEDAQAHLQLSEGPRSRVPCGEEIEKNVQIQQKDDEAQGQGEDELLQEPELDLQGSGVRQGGGADGDMQAQEKPESLGTMKDQSSGANVQLIAEGDELKSASGESTEADLQLMAGSSGTEQEGSVDPGVQPLHQEDKAELVEGEAEDAQADLQLSEGLSSGAPWVEWRGALHNEEEEEGGAQAQVENGLPQESVLAPEGAGGRQGEGTGAAAQQQEEAGRLHTLEAQSTDAAVQLLTDQQIPKSGSGGSTEADLTPLGVAGLWEGEQSLTLGVEAILGASPPAKPWEGAAAADVPPPAGAALCPEPAPAAEGPGLEANLGSCNGPEGQILEAQESLQGERALAEGKPLDGAHGLEVAQGERPEAGARNGVKTQGLGLNQGHDDAELASLVPEVLSQLSPLKLETMMQEDVLVPDVWWLCAPGQAAQRELQEQVSAQGHEGRPHKVTQQPERETPPTREPEHTAAGAAEHLKQEVPPASSLQKAVRPGDAGSDHLGVALRENSLGQRQLLGEQSKDTTVGQREKIQEFGEKMSQEGEPSSGEPGAVTAAGTGAAPQSCPRAALDPEHLYNVLFVGDSHVGKTSFLYRLHADTFNPHLTATVGLDYQIKNLVVDNKRFALRLWDSAGQERYRSMTKQFFRKAAGVVLMYDITSEYSFSDVRYWLSCIQEGAEDGVAVLLLGNKTDCAAQRQVPTKEGESLAKEHQLMFYECSAASGHNVFESMVSFTRLLKVREDELKNKTEEVPKAPQKKKSCCW